MKTPQRFLSRAWRPALALISLGCLVYLLYFHRLSSLLPGYASQELDAYRHAATWHAIATNPLNFPYKALVFVLASIGHLNNLIVTRTAAAICSVITVGVFFSITRSWYGFRVGFLSTVLFASSSGFLHFARLGTPQILQTGILMLIGILIWHRKQRTHRKLLTYLVVAMFALLCYVPGMIWFEIIAVAMLHKRALNYLQQNALIHQAAWLGASLVLVLPLLAAIALHPHLLLPVLGIPTNLASVAHLPLNLLHTVLSLGVRSDGSPLLWVGHTPLLDAMELILGALGVYYYIYQERSLRSWSLATAGIVSLVLVSLGGGVSFACIIPVAYLIISGGLHHFLGEWLAVFPRNPIARGAGILVVCCMLFFSVLYQLRSYYVAWPHSTSTRQTFDIEANLLQ